MYVGFLMFVSHSEFYQLITTSLQKFLEMLKTDSIFHVHCNRLLHTYYTAALCTHIAKVCYFQDKLLVAITLLKAETVLIYSA